MTNLLVPIFGLTGGALALAKGIQDYRNPQIDKKLAKAEITLGAVVLVATVLKTSFDFDVLTLSSKKAIILDEESISKTNPYLQTFYHSLLAGMTFPIGLYMTCTPLMYLDNVVRRRLNP